MFISKYFAKFIAERADMREAQPDDYAFSEWNGLAINGFNARDTDALDFGFEHPCAANENTPVSVAHLGARVGEAPFLAAEAQENHTQESQESVVILRLVAQAGALPLFHIVHVDKGNEKLLRTAEQDDEIIALWRGWGKFLNLPLMIETEEGMRYAMSPPARSFQHKRGSLLKNRRFRFQNTRLPRLYPLPNGMQQG